MTQSAMSLLTTADWLVIGAYFVVLFAVVFAHGATNRQNPTEFRLAGRNAGWFIVDASIFASNIGSEHLVGLTIAHRGEAAPREPLHRGDLALSALLLALVAAAWIYFS